MTIRIKNWSKHQHFKDRTPPWIKLYREILDDPDWHELSGDDSKVLVGLWLIASEDEAHLGTLPSVRKMAFRLRVSEDSLNQALNRLSHWLLRDDIEPISPCHQVGPPETETETETETDIAAKKPATTRARKTTFSAWIASLPPGADAIPADHHVFAYADGVKIPREFLDLAWIAFERRYASESKKYADWPAVFRKAVENNWLRIWYLKPDGDYVLTTVGCQLSIDVNREAA